MQGMNKLIKNCTKLCTVVSVALFLVACEIIIPKQIEVKEADVLAIYKDMPLAEVMNNVQKKFQKAKDSEIYFYSPNNYRTARTGLQTARAYFRDPEKKTAVLMGLYKADKALDDAEEVRVIVDRELAEHIKVLNFLVELDAKRSHGQEYRSMMSSVMSIIERIEKDKEAIFQDPERKKDMEERKKDMLDNLLAFRLDIVKYKYLNHATVLISEADNIDAKTIAPITYARTIAARDSAVKYVSENVENLEGIEDIAKKFQYEAERLLQISRAVDTLLRLEKDTQELYILKQEEYLQKIGDVLKDPKMQYDSFPAQVSRYVGLIQRIIGEKQDYAMQVAELKSATESGNVSVAPVSDEQPAATANDSGNAPKGLEIVPVGGDPEQMRKSLRILTDQVFQLTVEKNAWEGERAKLKSQIKKLQAGQKVESAPAEKPKTDTKPEEKKTETKAKTKAKTEDKSKTVDKSKPASSADSNSGKPEPEKVTEETKK